MVLRALWPASGGSTTLPMPRMSQMGYSDAAPRLPVDEQTTIYVTVTHKYPK
jgi:hypothetical protein